MSSILFRKTVNALSQSEPRQAELRPLGSVALPRQAEPRPLGRAYGLSAKDVGFDFAKVMERSRAVAGQMAKGVEFLFRKNKVEYFVGAGQVNAPGMVSITQGDHKGKFFRAKNILIA